jgi:murein DD-endopeptidase MepM/ murein hydrolase activator NlpD
MKKRLALTLLALSLTLSIPSQASAVSKPFSYPATNFRITQYASSSHMAVDFQSRALNYAPIYSIGAGKVVKVCRGYCSGWGNYLVVDHLNGYKSLYAHLNGFYVYTVGARVIKGQKLGTMGKSGRVYARYPILHLEVLRNGVKINPLSVIG